MSDCQWTDDLAAVDLAEPSELYRLAPLGDKPPVALATVFGNSMFKCFGDQDRTLVAAGRALAGGVDRDPAPAVAKGILSPAG
jgi:hypothetical protein